jgi:hypothetical protein
VGFWSREVVSAAKVNPEWLGWAFVWVTAAGRRGRVVMLASNFQATFGTMVGPGNSARCDLWT